MKYSLKNSREFSRVYENGRHRANGLLVVHVLTSSSDVNVDNIEELKDKNVRLGISVSKKVGNSVVRHRLTRLIRESFRKIKPEISVSCDIVVVARMSAKGKNYFEINEALVKLLKSHRII